MENKKTSLMDILIDFFATLYDLVIDSFASLYDLVYDSIIFLIEYVKWITTISSVENNDFKTPAEKPIQVHNHNPFEIR